MKKPGSRATVNDIARQCHLSAMTVSRALRCQPGVKADTRERVLAVAEELGYLRGSRLGRPERPRLERPERIQLICGSTGRNLAVFHSRLLFALETLFTAADCECLIRHSDGDYRIFTRMLAAARRSGAEATLLIGDFPEAQLDALQLAFPGALLLDNPGGSGVDATCGVIGFDNIAAARLGVGHLISGGRRRILLVSGERGHFFSAAIERGYREALAAAGIEFSPELLVNTDFSGSGAMHRVEEILERGIDFDAVFTNDEMAHGVYRALAVHGLAVPEKVAVCGCDALPGGELLTPPLSTIELDVEALAETAVSILFDGGARGRPPRLKLPVRLIVRESSAPSSGNYSAE